MASGSPGNGSATTNTNNSTWLTELDGLPPYDAVPTGPAIHRTVPIVEAAYKGLLGGSYTNGPPLDGTPNTKPRRDNTGKKGRNFLFVRDMRISKDSSTIAAIDEKDEVIIWDRESLNASGYFKVDKAWYLPLQKRAMPEMLHHVTAGGGLIAVKVYYSLKQENKLQVWDWKQKKLLHTLECEKSFIWAGFAVNGHCGLLAMVRRYQPRTVVLYRIEHPEANEQQATCVPTKLALPADAGLREFRLQFSTDGKRLVLLGAGGRTVVLDVDHSKVPRSYHLDPVSPSTRPDASPALHPRGVACGNSVLAVAWSSDEPSSAGDGGTVQVGWISISDPDTGELHNLISFPLGMHKIQSLHISDDGRFLYLPLPVPAAFAYTTAILDTISLRRVFMGSWRNVTSAAISRDMRFLSIGRVIPVSKDVQFSAVDLLELVPGQQCNPEQFPELALPFQKATEDSMRRGVAAAAVAVAAGVFTALASS